MNFSNYWQYKSRAIFWRRRKFELVNKSFFASQNNWILMDQTRLNWVSFFEIWCLVNSIAYFMSSFFFLVHFNQANCLFRDSNNSGVELEHKVTVYMIKIILMTQNIQTLLVWTSKYFSLELQKLKASFLLCHFKCV